MPKAKGSRSSLAVLASGGLDSAILLGVALRDYRQLYPLYIREGLHYEKTELRYLRRYLQALGCGQPLRILRLPVADLYGEHWSISGRDVPSQATPDEAVYLPGRNVLFLAKAMIWCHLHDVPAVATGSLRSNPFPDATPAFFAGFEKIVNQGIGGNIQIRVPFADMTKKEVMRLGQALPLEYTFSCIDPEDGLHCGKCNKCHERQRAFTDADMADPTRYAAKRLKHKTKSKK